MSSSYPPGHPTGIRRGQQTEIYFCNQCDTIYEKEELKPVTRDLRVCPTCKTLDHLERALCDCGKPATHIDTELDVNASAPFCDDCGA